MLQLPKLATPVRLRSPAPFFTQDKGQWKNCFPSRHVWSQLFCFQAVLLNVCRQRTLKFLWSVPICSRCSRIPRFLPTVSRNRMRHGNWPKEWIWLLQEKPKRSTNFFITKMLWSTFRICRIEPLRSIISTKIIISVFSSGLSAILSPGSLLLKNDG